VEIARKEQKQYKRRKLQGNVKQQRARDKEKDRQENKKNSDT